MFKLLLMAVCRCICMCPSLASHLINVIIHHEPNREHTQHDKSPKRMKPPRVTYMANRHLIGGWVSFGDISIQRNVSQNMKGSKFPSPLDHRIRKMNVLQPSHAPLFWAFKLGVYSAKRRRGRNLLIFLTQFFKTNWSVNFQVFEVAHCWSNHYNPWTCIGLHSAAHERQMRSSPRYARLNRRIHCCRLQRPGWHYGAT